MLDLILANKLIKAVPPGAHLLLVGDVDQLPSVGAGEVLRDVLAADTIPRVRLTTIFRQAQQSGVVVNAHRINAGQPPVFGEHPDFFLFPAEEPEATAERVVDLVVRRIPRKFGIPPREIQVLAPMHRGPAGAGALNTLLQQALAPAAEGTPERRHGARVFRPGDKVIQIRNNYDKGAAGVFNGTVGTITALSVTEQQLTVRTDEDEDIVYDFDELDELQHAYAITVHRSQGSEYPAVVVPLTMSVPCCSATFSTPRSPGPSAWLCWSAAARPWPSRSGRPAPVAATPPSPTACRNPATPPADPSGPARITGFRLRGRPTAAAPLRSAQPTRMIGAGRLQEQDGSVTGKHVPAPASRMRRTSGRQ